MYYGKEKKASSKEGKKKSGKKGQEKNCEETKIKFSIRTKNFRNKSEIFCFLPRTELRSGAGLC